MKKIITAVAAVAMATSMFAVDFGAAIKIKGDLFNMPLKEGAKASILSVKKAENRPSWGDSGISLNVAADKCGAHWEIDASGSMVNGSIWLQPVDMVKVTLGNTDTGYNTETIDYTKINSLGGYGVMCEIKPVEGLSIVADLISGEGGFWVKDQKVGTTIGKVSYSADFGSINASVLYDGTDTTVGAGYAGTFGSVSVAPAVAVKLADKTTITADTFVTANVDALLVKAYAKFVNSDKNNDLGAKLFVQYAMGGAKPYLKVTSDDFIADTVAVTVKPGAEFGVGSAWCDFGVQIDIKKDANKLSVPFYVNMNF